MKTLCFLAVTMSLCTPAAAQTIDDGIMMTARSLQAGVVRLGDGFGLQGISAVWRGQLGDFPK